MEIRRADLADPSIRDLVTTHQQRAFESSPPGTSFALDLRGLQRPEITLFGAWADDVLLGIGALMEIGGDTGEVKSMRTADAALRRGVGSAMLRNIEQEARRRGYVRLLLETGTGEVYMPANAMYLRHGYSRRGPFGEYADTGFNLFYEKLL